MKFKEFLKEKLVLLFFIICALLTIEMFLLAYSFDFFIKLYIPFAVLLASFIGILFEYFKKRKFYANLLRTLEELDEKYFLTEIIHAPTFAEGKILKEVLAQVDKSMLENVHTYKYLQEDYKEYIELWIHEIKIPIATSKMIIENNKNDITRSLAEELDKVENYIEQVLFYARSNTVEKDYYIKANVLKDIVNESIRKNKSTFIQNKVIIKTHDLDQVVYTDSKWIIFIISQLMQNSIQYRKKENSLEIKLYAEQGQEKIILYIEDNGIGIKEGEIARVFEKGFIGTNGRLQNKKSTGIGLYLCKKLCNKLGMSIELNSVQGIGTKVKLIFPKSSYINFHMSSFA